MRAIVVSDAKAIFIRTLCIVYLLISTIKVNQNSMTAIVFSIIAFFVLKKKSTHVEEVENQSSKRKSRNTDEHINTSEIENPYRKSTKLNYSELPNDVFRKAENDLINHFLVDYSYAKSLRGFQMIKSNTECQFAKKANLWGAAKWNVDIEIEDNIKNFIPSFILFCNFCTDMRLDGYVVELPGWIYGDDLNPEISFALHDLPPDTPHTKWDSPENVRDKIRVAYKNAGRPYNIRNTIHYPMAYDIIRPLNNDSGLIKWWSYRANIEKDKDL